MMVVTCGVHFTTKLPGHVNSICDVTSTIRARILSLPRTMSGHAHGLKRGRVGSSHDDDDGSSDDDVVFVSGTAFRPAPARSVPAHPANQQLNFHQHGDVMGHIGSYLTVADRGRARVAGLGAVTTGDDETVRAGSAACARCKEQVPEDDEPDPSNTEGPFYLPGDPRVKLCRACRLKGLRMNVTVEVRVPELKIMVRVPLTTFNSRSREEQSMSRLRDDLRRTLDMPADAITVPSIVQLREEKISGAVPPITLLSTLATKSALMRQVYSRYGDAEMPTNVLITYRLLSQSARTIDVTLRWAKPGGLLPTRLVDAALAVVTRAFERMRAPAFSGASAGAGGASASASGVLGGVRRRALNGRFTPSSPYFRA
jgi:hypothetical protein